MSMPFSALQRIQQQIPAAEGFSCARWSSVRTCPADLCSCMRCAFRRCAAASSWPRAASRRCRRCRAAACPASCAASMCCSIARYAASSMGTPAAMWPACQRFGCQIDSALQRRSKGKKWGRGAVTKLCVYCRRCRGFCTHEWANMQAQVFAAHAVCKRERLWSEGSRGKHATSMHRRALHHAKQMRQICLHTCSCRRVMLTSGTSRAAKALSSPPLSCITSAPGTTSLCCSA